jgi:hypothetical protein
MSLRGVCDAWATDLTTHVSALSDAVIHLYASWSVQKLSAQTGEIHLGIWPIPSPENIKPFATGSLPTDLVETAYQVLIWQLADTEVARRMDDVAQNGAWLDLAESVEDRFRVQSNTGAGQPGGYTSLKGGGVSWDLTGQYRWMAIAFTVRSTASFT